MRSYKSNSYVEAFVTIAFLLCVYVYELCSQLRLTNVFKE